MNEKCVRYGRIALYTMTSQDAVLIDREIMRRYMPQRLEKADRIRPENGRALSLAAGWLMLSVFGPVNENELRYGERGKPSIPGYPPFNISHSGEMAVMAVLEDEHSHKGLTLRPEPEKVYEGTPQEGVCSLGVDVEQIRERNLRVTKRAFTQDERSWLEQAPDPEERMRRFHRIWTLKEAVMKADGRGLGMDPVSFDVMGLKDGQSLMAGGRIWYAEQMQYEGYMISVCWGQD